MTIKEKYQAVKDHVGRKKQIYIYIGGGAAIAGITVVIMRSIASQHISPVIHGTASSVDHGTGASVAIQNTISGKNNVLNSVSYISANRTGPPSWVVRCLENNLVETSQHAMALAMNIPESDLSRHLNGILEHVNGYHFERICMAA